MAEAMSGDILSWICSDRLDIGYVYDIIDVSLVNSEPFLTEELFLATAPDNWPGEFGDNGMALQPILASNLAELPLVLAKQPPGTIKMREKIGRAIGGSPNVVAELDLLPYIVEMVSRASAYSILSHGAAVNQMVSGKLALVPIEEPTLSRTAYKVQLRDRPVKRAVMVIDQTITTIIREIVGRYNLRVTLPDQTGADVVAPRKAR